ncbi:MAG TPA: hypothetical protein VJ725_22435, partial [Thermoanaerobaculia bacterium]|nr:hypothetical protein [Thermoanaerobaculia bacterium]
MAHEKRSPEAVTLLALRSARGWPTKRLAEELGLAEERLIARYERGEKPLSRETLDRMGFGLGYSSETIEALLSAHRLLLFPPPPEEPSPVALLPEQRARIDRDALAAGWTLTEELRAELSGIERRKNADAAHREAGELWERLKTATRQERRHLVDIHAEFRSWALAVRVCEESERVASHRADEALELADLALLVAGRVSGEEGWRSRLQGYAWAYVANARRVANDFDGSDEAFTQAWALWRAGAGSASELLPEWRLLDLEASLRRAQQRFTEALERLDRARSLSAGAEAAIGRILLKKEHILSQMGDFEGALAALAEAAPYLEHSREPRHLAVLRFNTVDNLLHLERFAEAAELLPDVRDLVVQQANELDLVRVLWLEAKVLAGQGERRRAATALEQVQREFAAHKLPYDAALSSLDLALLRLEEKRTADVRDLALGMTWIFTSKKIHREALAALALFCEAAKHEAVTADLTRRVITRIEE